MQDSFYDTCISNVFIVMLIVKQHQSKLTKSTTNISKLFGHKQGSHCFSPGIEIPGEQGVPVFTVVCRPLSRQLGKHTVTHALSCSCRIPKPVASPCIDHNRLAGGPFH